MKNNRFQKQHILENITFQKQQQILKNQEISKNNKFQKTTNFKKQQIL